MKSFELQIFPKRPIKITIVDTTTGDMTHPVLFVSDAFFLSEDSLGEGIVIFVLQSAKYFVSFVFSGDCQE